MQDRSIMTTEQREQLREVLIDYLEVLTSSRGIMKTKYEVLHDKRIAQVRLLLREVA
jgi:hypothetical protein